SAMVVVAGGTSTLGSRVVRRLVRRGMRVRVLTRRPDRARAVLGEGVEVAFADVRDRLGVADAMLGVRTLVSAVHAFGGSRGVSPASLERAATGSLLAAAQEARAAFVYMSAVGVSPDHPLELFRAKHAAEELVRASTIPWTIVRSTPIVETWGRAMGEPLRATGRARVLGRGDNPINFVSVHDVAAVVEAVVLDPTLQRRLLEVGGPANITFNQLAEMLQEVVGVRGTVRHVPRTALRLVGHAVAPVRPSLARAARAATVMDTEDMTFDAVPARREIPGLPVTDVRTALAAFLAQ
ncbi:MAG TPA: NAD(P)H-binding protein, partial [Candidatus Dormibacteraeota bacterium]|nr:NAD(P)H-binding protein [Candidatus Dormibacteraeota bacterium]